MKFKLKAKVKIASKKSAPVETPKSGTMKTAIGGCTVTLFADGAGGALLEVTSSKEGRILACHVPPHSERNAGHWNCIEFGETLHSALSRLRR